jgi:poly(3-hydroxybutyrate) depolymerase
VKGDGDSSESHRVFYNEYLAVMDMPADYYLDTVRRVFLEYKLPNGAMKYHGDLLDTKAITETALLTIEGGRDDICGPGQTHAAHDICSSIPASKRSKFTEPRVGHYGTFNGRHFNEIIGPTITSFIRQHDKHLH